jgi:hypothetical protein
MAREGRMTVLVQIVLPLTDNDGRRFADAVLRGIQEELCDRFGGVTAYNRAPAEGVWQGGGTRQKEDVITVEVMADEIDRDWWSDFRKRTENLLGQDELVVRAHAIERL